MCSPGGGTKGEASGRSDNFIYKTAHFNADCVNVFKKKARKATGFWSLQLSYREINQATSKCQNDIWTKLARKI